VDERLGPKPELQRIVDAGEMPLARSNHPEESTAARNALLSDTEGLRQSLSRFGKTLTDKPVRGLPRLIAAAS
jgi:hypothetical protein